MSNQRACAGATPPEFSLDLTGADLTVLSTWSSPDVGSAASTDITAAAALIAGGIDGYLGSKAKVGPIGINVALALGAAAGSLLVKW
jgi:hypothetical protein